MGRERLQRESDVRDSTVIDSDVTDRDVTDSDVTNSEVTDSDVSDELSESPGYSQRFVASSLRSSSPPVFRSSHRPLTHSPMMNTEF